MSQSSAFTPVSPSKESPIVPTSSMVEDSVLGKEGGGVAESPVMDASTGITPVLDDMEVDEHFEKVSVAPSDGGEPTVSVASSRHSHPPILSRPLGPYRRTPRAVSALRIDTRAGPAQPPVISETDWAAWEKIERQRRKENLQPENSLQRRYIRMPKWTGPIFEEGMDWRAHEELIRSSILQHPGLNSQQQSQHFLDSLQPELQPHAIGRHSRKNLPPIDLMARMMSQVTHSILEEVDLNWDEEIRKLKQREGESLLHFTGKVMALLSQYKGSNQFSELDYPRIENQATLSLSFSTLDKYVEAVENAKKDWIRGLAKPDPESDFMSVYLTLVDIGRQEKKAELAAKAKKSGKSKVPLDGSNVNPKDLSKKFDTMCRYAPNCTRSGCRFKHPAPEKLNKRVREDGNEPGSSRKGLRCTHCGKGGHSVDTCFKLHPELRLKKD